MAGSLGDDYGFDFSSSDEALLCSLADAAEREAAKKAAAAAAETTFETTTTTKTTVTITRTTSTSTSVTFTNEASPRQARAAETTEDGGRRNVLETDFTTYRAADGASSPGAAADAVVADVDGDHTGARAATPHKTP
jgi:hypothetical protein